MKRTTPGFAAAGAVILAVFVAVALASLIPPAHGVTPSPAPAPAAIPQENR